MATTAQARSETERTPPQRSARKTARAVRRASAPRWTKAAPAAFKARAPLDEAIAAVIGGCRDHWQANTAAALDGRDPEGIHQVRVGIRRFRSALSLFKRFVPPHQRAWLNAEAKWLGNRLGPVRDLDVFIADLSARADADGADAGLALLTDAARTARAAAHAAAADALSSLRMRRFTARLDAWLAGRGWSAAGDDGLPDTAAFAREALNKRLAKIRDAAARAETLTVPERHALRIAVKKLRYGLEFLAPVLPAKRAARAGALLKRLQDSLGHLNDLDVAERTIARVCAAAPAAGRRRMRKAGAALAALHRQAAADAEPETARLCRKAARLGAF